MHERTEALGLQRSVARIRLPRMEGQRRVPAVMTKHFLRMNRFVAAISFFAFACVCDGAQSQVAARSVDGPYVMRTAEGHWEARAIAVTPEGAVARVQSIEPNATIEVPSVADVPGFRVKLRPPAKVSPDVVATATDAPLFVVADTHGEFGILVEMLRKQGIVDARLSWSFGNGHLIFLGDVFDRGPNQVEILWLIYQLEAAAARSGGGVHLVFGNHESMVLSGDLRYLNAKYPKSAQLLGVESYAALFGDDSVLGQWLRTKSAVLKINDLLCLHGGISQQVVARELTLQQINAAVRDAMSGKKLNAADRARADFVMGQLGPLWYRGYFADQGDFPTATSQDIDLIRKHFGVSTVLVGHTTVPTVTSLYDGRVIAVQVYPHREGATGRPVLESVRIEKGRIFRAKIDGTREPLLTQP